MALMDLAGKAYGVPAYALVGGRQGVASALAALSAELEEAMRLAGCAKVADTPGIAAPEG